jgi:SAM-dependent methyltransferase
LTAQREQSSRAPGWQRLWRHSLRLSIRWLATLPRHRLTGAKVAAQRGLVPLDPWRYYELGRIADERFEGECLDVSSPKLLPSLLQHEGQGRWTAVDLFQREIADWRAVDANLRLEVQDATALAYEDAAFDACVCASVVEHIPGDGDARAMAEIWRVLRPGGVLHLTTDVAPQTEDVLVDWPVYGEASQRVEGGVFFARRYGPEALERRLLQRPWDIEHREFARMRDEKLERRFYAGAPWSYAYGLLLRTRCPHNFNVTPVFPDLTGRKQGVVYLRLRKPAQEAAIKR